ncbi:MAG: AMP-binding protein, partial [Eubacteriales bacterium]|nr:AMP-binding protein [Eubacteriales bacterium]
MIQLNAPWLENYGEVPKTLDYPDYSMSEAVINTANSMPNDTALAFMGRKIKYSLLKKNIELTARSLSAIGVKADSRVTVCLPNIPQAVYSLYGINRIGAIASMIHPLSAIKEIEFYLNEVESETIIALDSFYDKIKEAIINTKVKKVIVVSISDELSAIKSVAYRLTSERENPPIEYSDKVIKWNDFISKGKSYTGEYVKNKKAGEGAVILFSGGTTGVTKGILLSNLNFNALAAQTVAMCNRQVRGKKMLAAMPVFHGFGLGVCVHTMLYEGGCSVLVPRFNVKSYAQLIKKIRPNYIAGVPTLYEALTKNPYMDGVKLDCLMGVFSGGDSLSPALKKRFDKFLSDHDSDVVIREGYGTTECVTASCLTPYHMESEGSIGFPFPDTYYKICKIGTNEEVPYGIEGEICLSGPTVMIEYINQPEENAQTLQNYEGRIWLHTGDLGVMDEQGFVYFKQRIKRVIITNGYNVYPSQIEGVLDAHKAVQMSCVIGVKDEYKMQRVKAFVSLRDGFMP